MKPLQELSPLPIRIISRLDVKKPNVVKGIHLEGLRIVGAPDQLAVRYQEQGVDEMVFIDCVASLYQRNTVFDVIEGVAERLRIPFTVGGGIKSIDEITHLLYRGADKVLLNTAAVNDPKLITDAALKFGSQCVVVSVEAKGKASGGWVAYVDNGRENTGLDVIDWVKRAEELGAGEIFLTSIDRDGMRKGFDIPLCSSVINSVNIPVIVSGGAGKPEDVKEVIDACCPSGVALGSAIHYGQFSVSDVKDYLEEERIPVRNIK